MTRPPFTGGTAVSVYGSEEDQARVERLLVKAGAVVVHRHMRKTTAGQRPILELTIQLPPEERSP